MLICGEILLPPMEMRKGGKLRDFAAKIMTATQIEKAQELAQECVAKKYKGC
jgi:hypothetical protein